MPAGRPPALLPAGARGARGGAAIAAALGSVAVIWTLRLVGIGLSGSGGGTTTLSDGLAVEYSYGEDSGLDITAAVLALALAGAALSLWAARDRRLVLAAWGACGVAVVATPTVVVSRQSAGWVTSSQVRELETGMSRSAVLDRLGEPAGAATVDTPGSTGVDCVVYLRRTREDHEVQPLCFRHGRLAYSELRR